MCALCYKSTVDIASVTWDTAFKSSRTPFKQRREIKSVRFCASTPLSLAFKVLMIKPFRLYSQTQPQILLNQRNSANLMHLWGGRNHITEAAEILKVCVCASEWCLDASRFNCTSWEVIKPETYYMWLMLNFQGKKPITQYQKGYFFAHVPKQYNIYIYFSWHGPIVFPFF